MQENNKSVITNFFWRFAERCGAQGVSFIVSIVLARLLSPETYGTIAIVTVFTSILQVFVDSGLGNALIQKKNADDLDFSTVYYFNIFICLILYAIMFFCAPLVAGFYNDNSLVPVIRVLSLTIVISGIKNIQQAYISRTMQFKRFFFATLGGTIGAAVIGIVLAYMGYGVWALVIQQLFNASVDTIILWMTVRWRPQREFSFQRLKGLLKFGSKLLFSSLLETLYNNVRQLVIGKMYSTSDLAFYNRGKQFPDLFITNINSSIDSVLLPTMSKEQDNREKVRELTRYSIKISIYIMAPLMMGLAFCAEPVVRLVLSDKWVECIPFLRIFCITSMFYPIHTANLNAIKAMGRSDLFLILEIIKKIVGVIALLGTMWISVKAMAYSLLVTSVLSQVINSWPNRNLLDYSYPKQVTDILPSIILAVLMGTVVSFFSLLNLSDIVTIFIQVIVGAIVYLVGSVVFKLDSFYYIVNILKQYIYKTNS